MAPFVSLLNLLLWFSKAAALQDEGGNSACAVVYLAQSKNVSLVFFSLPQQSPVGHEP